VIDPAARTRWRPFFFKEGIMTEIELKAHVANPEDTEKKIRTFAAFKGETEKFDAYWTNNAGKNGQAAQNPVKVRIREESGLIVVTYKKKERQGAIEVNDEREFTIDNREAFETLITDLGFSRDSLKHKKTKSFDYVAHDGADSTHSVAGAHGAHGAHDENSAGNTPVTIELSLVDPLGWFVEIEILKDNPDSETIERSRKILGETLKLCGIGEDAIEMRYYTEMIAAANRAR
jgi:adenylate cyclase class 2